MKMNDMRDTIVGRTFTSWRQHFVDGTVDAICDIFREKMAENENRRLLTDLLNGKTVLEMPYSVVIGPWRLRLRAEWVNPVGTRAPAGDSEHDGFQPPDSDDYSAIERLCDGVSGVPEPRQ
jgi:hypothetical protein